MVVDSSLSALIITNTFPPNFDGVGDYSANLYNLLRSRGKKVGVITTQRNVLDNRGISQPDIFTIKPNWGFRECIVLWKILKQQEIKTLLIQFEPYSFSKSGFSLVFILFIGYLKFSKIEIRTNFHEIAVRFRGANFFSKIRSIVQRTLAYLLCFFSDSIQTSNGYYKNQLLPFKSTLIPIPSNFEKFVSETEAVKFKWGNNIIIVANANRCNEVFFNVINELVKAKDIKIIIIGRAYENDLTFIHNSINKFKLNNLFEICVNTSPQLLVATMKRATFFVQLELVTAENFGGVSSKSGTTALAMQLGIPIISTLGDMTDKNLFKDGINISLVPYNDAKGIARKIVELSNDDEKRLAISHAAIQSYWNHFSWEHTLNYYLKFLN